nr:MAG TPA: Protein of unknown function (DUF1376) [Caudoviricetes sp.]
MTTTDIHFITHNFGDWDSDTKHMTRNQRAIYLDLRTLYFSTAQKSSGSLTMDFDLLCFKMGCRTDSDCTDLKWLLKDKFKIINKKYRHATWDEQIKNIRFAMEKSCNAGNVASNGGNAQNNTSNAPCNAKSNEGNVASNAKIYNNTGGYVMTSTERSEKSRKLKALINQGLDVDKNMALDEIRSLYNSHFNASCNAQNNSECNDECNAPCNASNAQIPENINNHNNNHNNKSSSVVYNSETLQNQPSNTHNTTTGFDKNKSISQWQPPSLDLLAEILQQSGCKQLTQDEFNTVFAKFVSYNVNREAQGKYLMTEQIRMDKLIDWIKREKPTHASDSSFSVKSDSHDFSDETVEKGYYVFDGVKLPREFDSKTMFTFEKQWLYCFDGYTPEQSKQIMQDYKIQTETTIEAYKRISSLGVANCQKPEVRKPVDDAYISKQLARLHANLAAKPAQRV